MKDTHSTIVWCPAKIHQSVVSQEAAVVLTFL